MTLRSRLSRRPFVVLWKERSGILDPWAAPRCNPNRRLTQYCSLPFKFIPRKSPKNLRLSERTSDAKASSKKKAGVAKPGNPLSPRSPSWTFLTNHAHTLILLSQESSIIL